MFVDNEMLRKVQMVELEILKYFDSFCKEHDLHYSLSGGTLIGAIRHKGFIPWDDDVDCMMSREDYERMFEIWDKYADKEHFFLQRKDNDGGFSQSFAKIRMNNTLYLQENEPKGKYNQGLFIDIMPADRYPNGKLAQFDFKLNFLFYQLYTREYPPVKNGGAVKLISNIILFIVPKSLRPKLRKMHLKHITKYNGDKSLRYISIETFDSIHRLYSPDVLDSFIDVDFEDTKLSVTSKWEEILTVGYGDYMQLPPEEDRVLKHHPREVDLGNRQ